MKTIPTNDPIEAIKSHLDFCYSIKGPIATRYAKLILKRAVAIYLDKHLDIDTVDEDLYTEDGKYVNLQYSEKNQPLEAVYRDSGVA